MVIKKTLIERNIYTKYITPALIESGWNLLSQLMRFSPPEKLMQSVLKEAFEN